MARLQKLLDERKIDGFWANGMGSEVAVQRGVGTVVHDVRRGDGPKPCFNYTMASIAASDRLIERSPETAAAAVRAKSEGPPIPAPDPPPASARQAR